MFLLVSGATDPSPRRASRRLMAITVAFLALGAAAVYLGLGSPAPADARDHIPEDVGTAVVVPELSALHAGITEFLLGIEGASGLIELVSAEVGVDLSSLEVLESQGVSPTGSLVVFQRGPATVLQVSVTSEARFRELVRERVAPGLGAELASGIAPDDSDVEIAELPLGLGLAWGSMHPGLGTLIVTPTVHSAPERWAEIAEAPSAPLAPPSASGLVWAIGDLAPALPESLGPARMVLSSYISPLSRWTGSLSASGSGLNLTVDGLWQGSGTPPLSFFHPPTQGKALRSYLPSTSAALVTGAWRPQSISSMPAWIRTTILPERLPGLAGATLPPTRELLDLLHGDLAFAVFGLSRTHAVDLSRMPRSVTELMTRLLGVGFLIRAANGERIAGVLANVAEALAERGWRVTPISKGPWIGFDLYSSRPEQHWALVARDDVAALVTASELPGLVEVALASASPHGAPTEKAPATFGIHVTFERLARELASRGLPPYFLTMMSGVTRINLEGSLHEKGVKFQVEVGL